jgi:hypothetical protein
MKNKFIFCFFVITTLTIPVLSAQQADAGADIYLLAPNASTALNANMPLFPNYGQWNLLCGNGDFFGGDDPNSTFITYDYGANFLVWSIYDDATQTVSSDTVIVFLYDVNPPVDCDSQVEFCVAPSTFHLSSAVSPSGSVLWEVISGGCTLSDDDSTSLTVTNIITGITIIQETKTENCLTQVCFHTISVSENSVVNAGEDVFTFNCFSDEIVLDGSIPLYGAIGTWTQLSGPPLSLNDIHDPHAHVLTEFIGQVQLQWQIEEAGACSGNVAEDLVTLTAVEEDPYEPDAGPDQYVCQNSAQLQSNYESFLGFGAYWTVIQGSGQFSDSLIYNPIITGLSSGENIIRLTMNLYCSSPIVSDVSIFVMDNQTVDAGLDLTICAGDVVQLNAVATPSAGVTYSWNPNPGLSATNISNPFASPLAQGVYTVTAVWGDGCTDSDQVTIFVNPVPAVSAGLDVILCYSNDPVQLIGSPNSNGVWSGPMTTTSGLFTPNLEGVFTVTYTFQNNVACTSTDEVEITVVLTGNGCPEMDGCTDPTACNYEATAQVDDGSCNYPLPGQVDCFTIQDLLELIENFGCINIPECAPYDLDGDGVVGVSDLIILMGEL